MASLAHDRPCAATDDAYLAPNGYPSHLPPALWRFVRTDTFKAWFGDWEQCPEHASQVVDSNGEPRPVYHGTHHAFTAFDLRKAARRSRTGYDPPSLFFTDSRYVASSYGPRILTTFLNLRKPFTCESKGTWKQMTFRNGFLLTGAPPGVQWGYLIVPPDELPPRAVIEREVCDGQYVNVRVPYPTLGSINQVALWAVNSGFDGLIAPNVFDMGSETGRRVNSTTLVAHHPSQVLVVEEEVAPQ